MVHIRRLFSAAAASFLLFGFIIYSKAVSSAVCASLKRCAEVIIPSLFAFMAMSKLLIRTGIADSLFKPFDKALHLLLRLPEGAGSVFIISNIAGYPVGSSMLKEKVLLGYTDKQSAEVMNLYCYGAGPAFLINAVGCSIFGISRIGVCIYLSVISANIVLAAVTNRIYRPQMKSNISNTEKRPFSEELVLSVTASGEDIFKMCSVIVFFSVIIAAADSLGLIGSITKLLCLSDNGQDVFKSIIEITNLNSINKNAYGLLPYVCAVCGFGGICVITQIKAVVGNTLSFKLFFLWLPIRTVLDYSFMKLYIMLFFGNSIPVFAKSDDIIVRIDNFIPSICLIMMIFILLFQKGLDFLKRV